MSVSSAGSRPSHVDRTTLDHLAGGAQPVAVEPLQFAMRSTSPVAMPTPPSAGLRFSLNASSLGASADAKSARLVASFERNASSSDSAARDVPAACLATAFGPPSRTGRDLLAAGSARDRHARWTSPPRRAARPNARARSRRHIAFCMPSFGMQSTEIMAGSSDADLAERERGAVGRYGQIARRR